MRLYPLLTDVCRRGFTPRLITVSFLMAVMTTSGIASSPTAPIPVSPGENRAQAEIGDSPIVSTSNNIELADDDTVGSPLDIMLRLSELYWNHRKLINDVARSAWQHSVSAYQSWQANHPAAAGIETEYTSSVQKFLDASPYLTVQIEQSPCAGPNTLRVRYHIDGSTDCVNTADARPATIGGASLLFVMTVDSDGNPNNAEVFQDAPDIGVKFLGTVTLVDHHGFSMNFGTPGATAAQVSWDNTDGSRTLCTLGWNDRLTETRFGTDGQAC